MAIAEVKPRVAWTRGLLAEIAAREGIVELVSVAEVGRLLKKRGLQPHRSHQWLNPAIEDEAAF
jgi:hypothetical protein